MALTAGLSIPTPQLTLILHTADGQRYFFSQPVSLTEPVGMATLSQLWETLRYRANKLCESYGLTATRVELGFEDGRLL